MNVHFVRPLSRFFFSHQKQEDDPGVHDQGARSSFYHFRHTMNEVLN